MPARPYGRRPRFSTLAFRTLHAALRPPLGKACFMPLRRREPHLIVRMNVAVELHPRQIGGPPSSLRHPPTHPHS